MLHPGRAQVAPIYRGELHVMIIATVYMRGSGSSLSLRSDKRPGGSYGVTGAMLVACGLEEASQLTCLSCALIGDAHLYSRSFQLWWSYEGYLYSCT